MAELERHSTAGAHEITTPLAEHSRGSFARHIRQPHCYLVRPQRRPALPLAQNAMEANRARIAARPKLWR